MDTQRSPSKLNFDSLLDQDSTGKRQFEITFPHSTSGKRSAFDEKLSQ